MKGGSSRYYIRNKNLIYPELSFRINGALFDVFSQIGGGHKERHYQEAVRFSLKKRGLKFTEQHYVPLKFDGNIIGKYFLDFLIEDKVVLELKRGKFIPSNVINQAIQYLEALDLKLAIIGCFAHDCVVPKRIIHPKCL